ncbi:hypothetical protein MNBD_GAMMA23-1298 [hydrothermal vent metagenome]|uniref:Lipoprotein n=1 Tax=hydrothermal vent metagenome TaxID=652676 RepID=A0A3B1ABE4_9ZZZZ
MIKNIFVAIITSGLLVGCASATLAGFHDPAYKGRQFKHILVVTDNLGLQEADYLQKRFCKTVNRFTKTKCSTELSFYLPTRDYTPKERKAILNQSGVDSILLYSRNKDEKGIKGHSQISFNVAEVFGAGPSSMNITGPGFSNTRTAGFRVVLIDVANYKKAWVAGVTTSGSDGAASDENILWTTTNRVYNALKSANLILR